MRVSRYLRYAVLGLLASLALPYAHAIERPVSYAYTALGEFLGAAWARHEATLAQWRQDSAGEPVLSTGGLRAEGHHLVQVTVPLRELPVLI